MITTAENIDAAEVAKFDAVAARWWDPQGECKPLHDINPLRLGYITARASLAGTRVVDVGCGGGLLSEAMARAGARVVGIDASTAALAVARLHLLESGAQVSYESCTAEQLALREPGAFDSVTCMEMLEHVPDPQAVIAACAQLVRPGGTVFLSTLNRNPKAYLHAVIGAEYLLRMLPQGTHDYRKFIRPSELAAWLRAAGLRLVGVQGLSYNPLTRTYRLGSDIDVNYLVHAVRDV